MQHDGFPVALQIASDERTVPGDTIDSEAAIRVAKAESGGNQAQDASARLVRLSVQSELDGTSVVENRRLWLITLPGVPFTAQSCACSVDNSSPPSKPDTAVLIDPTDGGVILVLGVP